MAIVACDGCCAQSNSPTAKTAISVMMTTSIFLFVFIFDCGFVFDAAYL
jgi:hypothetical protein